MKWILPALILLLGGCGAKIVSTPEPIVVTQDVAVAIAGACVPKGLANEPAYPDTDAALLEAPEGPVRFQLLVLGRAQRIARLLEIEPVIRGCPKEN